MKVEGGDRLARTLAALPAALSTRVQTEALVEGAELIAQRARALAPRGTAPPHLADVIVAGPVRRTTGEKLEGVQATAGVGVPRNFYYDTFAEFGAKHVPAHAFYRPALDETAGQVITRIGRALWQALAARGATSGRGSSSGGGLT